MNLNKAATVLIAKYFMTFVPAAITFNLINLNGWSWVLAVSIAAATFNYLLGDHYMLPRYGNVAASVVNSVLAVLTAYFSDLMLPPFDTSPQSLVSFGLLIAVGEYVFHRYLMRSEAVRP